MPPRRQTQLVTTRDFTGGINLSRNVVQLHPNESPDMLNVDVSERGGFRLRRGVSPYVDVKFDGAIESLHGYMTTAGIRQVIAHLDEGTILTVDGSPTQIATDRNGAVVSTSFKDIIYLSDGEEKTVRWDGSTAQELNASWNEDLENPGSGQNFPKARALAVYRGCVFAANTYDEDEDDIRYPNRVRWSHPNHPEAWRSLDFIDVDAEHEGDQIVALVPFEDRLLVFKEHSIHAIVGEPPEGFAVYPISTDVGTISQHTVVSTDKGVYFFDWPGGVFLYDGRNIEWKFSRLHAAMVNGDIPPGGAPGIRMGFGFRRLWLAVPWKGKNTIERTFVYAPHVGKDGAWVKYDLKVGPFLEWDPPGTSAPLLLAGHGQRVLKLEQNQAYDDFGEPDEAVYPAEDNYCDVALFPNTESGARQRRIESYYQTPWFDLGEHAVKKRWKRPEVILLDKQNAVVMVRVYKDYDIDRHTKTLTYRTNAEDLEGGIFGIARFGVDRFAGGSDDESWVVERTSPIGSARAVSLRFFGPPDLRDWGVNALTLKVKPKPVRN